MMREHVFGLVFLNQRRTCCKCFCPTSLRSLTPQIWECHVVFIVQSLTVISCLCTVCRVIITDSKSDYAVPGLNYFWFHSLSCRALVAVDMRQQAVEYYDSHVHSTAENAYDSVLVSVKYMLKNQCHLRFYGFLYCICLLFFRGFSSQLLEDFIEVVDGVHTDHLKQAV
jgi:hypothetical protein